MVTQRRSERRARPVHSWQRVSGSGSGSGSQGKIITPSSPNRRARHVRLWLSSFPLLFFFVPFPRTLRTISPVCDAPSIRPSLASTSPIIIAVVDPSLSSHSIFFSQCPPPARDTEAVHLTAPLSPFRPALSLNTVLPLGLDLLNHRATPSRSRHSSSSCRSLAQPFLL